MVVSCSSSSVLELELLLLLLLNDGDLSPDWGGAGLEVGDLLCLTGAYRGEAAGWTGAYIGEGDGPTRGEQGGSRKLGTRHSLSGIETTRVSFSFTRFPAFCRSGMASPSDLPFTLIPLTSTSSSRRWMALVRWARPPSVMEEMSIGGGRSSLH